MSFFYKRAGRNDYQIIQEFRAGLQRLQAASPQVNQPPLSHGQSSSCVEFIIVHHLNLLPLPVLTRGRNKNQLMVDLIAIEQDEASKERHHRHSNLSHQSRVHSAWGCANTLKLGTLIILIINCREILRQIRLFAERIQRAEMETSAAQDKVIIAEQNLAFVQRIGNNIQWINSCKIKLQNAKNVRDLARELADDLQLDITVSAHFGPHIIGYSNSYTRDKVLTRKDCRAGSMKIVTYGEPRVVRFTNPSPTHLVSNCTNRHTSTHIAENAMKLCIYRDTILIPISFDVNGDMAQWIHLLNLYRSIPDSPVRTIWDILLSGIKCTDNLTLKAVPAKRCRMHLAQPTPEQQEEGLNVFALMANASYWEYQLQRITPFTPASKRTTIHEGALDANRLLRMARTTNIIKATNLLDMMMTRRSGDTNTNIKKYDEYCKAVVIGIASSCYNNSRHANIGNIKGQE